MALVDQYGKPLKAPVTQKESMGASVVGSRPAITDSIVTLGLNPADVGALMRSAAVGNSWDWQIFCEIIEERDLHYLGVLNTRKRSVAQLPMNVVDAGPSRMQRRHGDFVRDWLDKGIAQRAAFDILDAIAKGFSIHEIFWHNEAGNYWPERLVYRPQRWFEISYQDGETIWLRDDTRTSRPAIEGAVDEAAMRPLDPARTLVHRHPSWSGLTIRSGLTRAVAFNSLFKLFSNRDWGLFVQAYGVPLRIGKFDASSTADDRATLWRALTDVAGAGACMIPDRMQMTFVEPKNGAGSNDTHERRIKWLDEQTSKAVLGQTGTTDARHGTHAAAATHRLVQEDIERSDAALLAETLNSQLVKQMIDYSFGPPKDGHYPRINIGRPDEAPVEVIIDAVQKAGPQGFKVAAKDLYARLNLEPPEEGDDVVGIAVPPQPALPAKVTSPKQMAGEETPPHFPTPTSRDEQPAPEEQPEKLSLHAAVGRLVDRSVSRSPQIIEALTDHLAYEAATGLGAMTEAVREQMEQATSWEDMKRRLEDLKLPDEQFAKAMEQALLVSELAGEAQMLEEMKHA
ncbi:DUF935 family protein [Saccharibacter sp. 17.LH.SD]|uniref:DUF935 domain-containing protein n=1 Tax=Saccharibacter sp. 17.LH.SD TaxID=2689393 RepID=UPI001368A9D7|nr:DUF935 family protein [Saccharibacter sp. 17.LH.SD]